MSFFRVNQNDISSFTIVTNPIRTYTSSSATGVTGSVHVFPRRSSVEKDVSTNSAFVDATHDESDPNALLQAVQQTARIIRNATSSSLASSLPGMLASYLNSVNAQLQSVRKQKVLEIDRFTPSFTYTENTAKKLLVKELLQPFYRTTYPSAHWAYTNYNSLSFFTASTVPTSSVLLYPNIEAPLSQFHEGYVSGTYTPSGSFSFDFYINPRYNQAVGDTDFKAGTLLHLSSCYAVSLVSGSSRDPNGKANAFRLQLQLSHSADIPPSLAKHGSYPNDLVFLSDDNALSLNNWHHVVIRWGTNLTNNGTGSFNIDKVDCGTFVVPSGTIAPKLFSLSTFANPDVLCVGNYYEGKNQGTSAQAYFFANDPALRDGLQQLIDDVGGTDEPLHYAFNHPLNADVHDIALKRFYMSDNDIVASSSVGPKSIDDSIALYIPPFFVEESPFRQFVGNHGGILQTPFFEVDGTTSDPFNVAMSFGVAGHYVNTENFVRDFASNVFPRLHHMTGTAIVGTTQARSANDFLYDQPFVRRRNLFVLPCDDGNFVPSFELLESESMQRKFVDDHGSPELSFINLDNLVSTASLLFGAGAFEDASTTSGHAAEFANESIGFTPEQPGIAPGRAFLNYVSNVNKTIASGTFDPGVQDGAPLTIFQRTRDASSNQVTFFNISNLFYGTRILPKSFEMRDASLSGSVGAVGITLKDDGLGNLYRADCITNASTWNSVGSIYYAEGLVVIKSPHLFFFGKEGYEVSFRGEQNVHVMKIDVIAPANQLNSSSNPSFLPVPPSQFANDPDKEFVYISGMTFHDNDFNVVMKTSLAQPIIKRHGDRISFKIRHDF